MGRRKGGEKKEVAMGQEAMEQKGRKSQERGKAGRGSGGGRRRRTKGEKPVPWEEKGQSHSRWPHRVNANVHSSDGSGIIILHLEKKHAFDTQDRARVPGGRKCGRGGPEQ